MENLEFKSKLIKYNISVPETGFKNEEQIIELREDPLTGRLCRINILRKTRNFQTSEDKQYAMPVSAEEGCPFCADNIEDKTPKFYRSKVKNGRMRLGTSVLFPNRYGYSKHHAIVAMTRKHFIPIDKIKVEDIHDALILSIKYLTLIGSESDQDFYTMINWNYMPPSGASIIHPHLQIVADESPTKLLKEVLKKSWEYYKNNSRNYWLNLIDVERKLGERFIGEDGFTVWTASYVPSGNNEVVAFLPFVSSLSELGGELLYSLAKGIEKLMSGYACMGVKSFNMSTFSDEFKSSSSHFSLHFKFISRPEFTPYYISDRGFMETLQIEPIIVQKPEDTAKELRPFFQKQ